MANVPRTRACFIVLAAFLALAAVFAGVFVFAVLDHDCVGEACLICPHLASARRLIESLGRTGFMILMAGFAARGAVPEKRSSAHVSFPLTLIGLKTKCNS
jgi:hypothetical protein